MKENSSWLRAEPENKMQRETGWRKNRPDRLQNQMTIYTEIGWRKNRPDCLQNQRQNAERDRTKEKSSWLPAEPDDKMQDRDRMKEKSPWLPAETRGSSTERGWMKKNRPGCLQNQTTKCRTNAGWCKTRPDKMRKNRCYLQNKKTKYRTDQMKEISSCFNKMQNQRTKCRDRTKKKIILIAGRTRGKIQRPDENK